MEHLLFLAHRIPYPPNKGDKIRSFRLLEYLSQHYHIHLGTFIDSPNDWQYCEQVSRYCHTTWFGRLSPSVAKWRSLTGLLTGQPLSLPYYYQRAFAHWVVTTCNHYHITRALVYSSAMAQYITPAQLAPLHCVVDFVDVDSDKWRQYSKTQPWPLNLIYRREAKQLARFEYTIAARAAASVFVSEPEAALFRQHIHPISTAQIIAIRNGVDSQFFMPNTTHPSPFAADTMPIVFTGAMDYWANIEGVTWFAQTLFPAIRAIHPNAVFVIVGMNPTPAVYQLTHSPHVMVTGAVADIRPYLQHAHVVVVPLRIARGIQNKVLEAMSMARPVITTPQALEGIPAQHGIHLYCAHTETAWINSIDQVLTTAHHAMGLRARQFVEGEFNWQHSLPRLLSVLEKSP